VNMTSSYDVTNCVYPVKMTNIHHCSILEFGKGPTNQAVAPGIIIPRHATGPWTHLVQGSCFVQYFFYKIWWIQDSLMICDKIFMFLEIHQMALKQCYVSLLSWNVVFCQTKKKFLYNLVFFNYSNCSFLRICSQTYF